MHTQFENSTARVTKPLRHAVVATGSGRDGGDGDFKIASSGAPRRPLMTTAEAAKYCGLAKNTLEKMRLYGRKDDNTPRFIKLGAAVRYDPDDLDVWIARNRAITTSEYDPSI